MEMTDQCYVWVWVRRPVQLGLTHVNVFSHLFGVWRWRNDITQFMSKVIKSNGLIVWIHILQFFTLQALVEHLGIWSCGLGLKVTVLSNCVRFRPSIWDGEATSSTNCWGWDKSPLAGVWVLHLLEGQSSEGWAFYQYSCWNLGQSLNVYGFFGLSSDLRGILVNNDKVCQRCHHQLLL